MALAGKPIDSHPPEHNAEQQPTGVWISPEHLLPFLFFSFIPECIHFFKAHIMQYLSLCRCHLFYMLKPADEFFISLIQRHFRIYLCKACIVHKGKQYIPHFFFYLFLLTFL